MSASGIREAWREAEELAAQVLGLGRAGLWAAMEDGISPDHEARIQGLFERRSSREPLQLILETWDFMGLPLAMEKGVFIPRPETESIARYGLERLRLESVGSKAGSWILDLGLGSGALLASVLALGPPGLRGLGVDRSPVACFLAKRNLEKLGLSAKSFVIRADWASGLNPKARFGLLVSNPPYLDPKIAKELEPEIAWDPEAALYSGEGGMADIRKVLGIAEKHVAPGGWLALESGPLLASQSLGLLGESWDQAALIREPGGTPVGIGARKRL